MIRGKRVAGRRLEALRRRWEGIILEAWAKGMPVQCSAVVCLMPSRTIGPASTWDMGHDVAIAEGGAVWDVSTLTPQHARCNRSEGQAIAVRRRSSSSRRLRG